MSVVARWQLPPVHVDVVLEYLGLGDPVLPLAVPSFGHTTEQFADIGRRELGNMVANGTVVDDEVHPALAEALRLLAHPHLWVDSLWFPRVGEDHCWRAVAVRTEDDRVVLGVQPPAQDPLFGGTLTVEVHRDVPLPQVLLGTLPPAPPGNRGAAKVPASSFRVGQEEPEPGAVLHDPRVIAERCVRLARGEPIEAVDGSEIKVEADSICVHGDSPDAVAIAEAVRERLVA